MKALGNLAMTADGENDSIKHKIVYQEGLLACLIKAFDPESCVLEEYTTFNAESLRLSTAFHSSPLAPTAAPA